MVGCLVAALTYFPLFKGLTHYVNPALEQYASSTPVSVAATDCSMHIFPTPKTRYSDCDKARDFLTKNGLSFTEIPAVGNETVVTKIGAIELHGWDEDSTGRPEDRAIPPPSTKPPSTGP